VPRDLAFPAEAPIVSPAYEALLPTLVPRPANETLLTLFAAATDDDATAAWRTDPGHEARGAGALLRHLVAAAVRAPPVAEPVHLQLARAFGTDAVGAELIRRALVLCADHELNASGFTARCVASTGASLRAAVIGGLAALSGFRHGSMTVRVESFWTALSAGDMAGKIRRRLESGEAIPGFHHPLYPQGDVRAKALLPHLLPCMPEAREIIAHVADLTGTHPSVDFALVALRRALGLPEGAAFLLFAIGRCVGWIAHAREQRATQSLIRPRAVYVGSRPV
jgi:citrate synthase